MAPGVRGHGGRPGVPPPLGRTGRRPHRHRHLSDVETAMDIHFNHTEPVAAPAEALFEVITDYAGYSRFNPAVVKMTVVARHENGAEFVAKCKTRIAREVRAFDRYQRHGDLVIKRTYGPESAAQSTWTIRPVDGGPLHPHHRRVEHDAIRARSRDEAPPAAALLRHQLQSFIQEAQRRANATRTQTD
ncbi:MAG TPA: SRPBCC family protein [Pseudonocardiaceae bacterium]|nr:SRPBCC family protein [Pseudonocardiaceae bacterium]